MLVAQAATEKRTISKQEAKKRLRNGLMAMVSLLFVVPFIFFVYDMPSACVVFVAAVACLAGYLINLLVLVKRSIRYCVWK